MTAQRDFLRHLSGALASGPWQMAAMQARVQQLLAGSPAWLPPLLVELVEQFGPTAPAPSHLATFIANQPDFIDAWSDPDRRPVARSLPLYSNSYGPPPPFAPEPPVAVDTPAALADWLGLTSTELDWFADPKGRQRRVDREPLRHYRYRWIPRPGRPRLLEVPKARLKRLQRRLLDQVLAACPPHPAAHGFRPGHSRLDYVGPHCANPLVLHMDLRDFFTSVRSSRIHALFRTLGYPWGIARLLAGLCTNSVPDSVLAGAGLQWPDRQRLAAPHLPQGAPSSPALANLAAYGLDRRLTGLARSRGLQYSRYADDLAFSGPPAGPSRRRYFTSLVAAIALEEGFEVNHRKTGFMTSATRQQLTGIAINRHPNIARDRYDALKATLFNCVRFGPASQNRCHQGDFRAHLAGRIGEVEVINPRRARRLRDLFDQIDWHDRSG